MANGWWNDNGNIAGAVAAYSPVGAASLAASYSNLANPGTYDAAPVGGSTPSFSAVTGWTFNGSSQYLDTGLTPTTDLTWSMIIRYSGFAAGSSKALAGTYKDTGSPQGTFLIQSDSAAAMAIRNGSIASVATNAPALAAGVYGIAGRTAYRNGVAESNLFPANTGPGAYSIYIGAMHYQTGAANFGASTIQAIAIYNTTLTAGEVATLTTRMLALPIASAKGLPIIAHHHRQVWG